MLAAKRASNVHIQQKLVTSLMQNRRQQAKKENPKTNPKNKECYRTDCFLVQQ
jgi:hypothetical protein